MWKQSIIVKTLSVLIMLICSLHLCSFAAYYRVTQKDVTAPDTPSSSENNAYIIFSDIVQTNNMTFEDGLNQDINSETYSEKAVFAGVESRQVFVQNHLYLKLDQSFAEESDRVFCLIFDYWDYDGGGLFYVDYTKAGGDLQSEDYGRLEIPKLGVEGSNNPKWHRATVYIDDASFTAGMPYNSDIRIVSRAYNAFSKIEIINLSRTAKDGNEDFGVFNTKKANSLHALGLYDGIGKENEDFIPGLEKELTRGEALVNLVKSYGLEDEVVSANALTSFNDIEDEAKPYIAMAEKLGVIKNSGNNLLNPDEKITQGELIGYYIKLLKLDAEYNDENIEDISRNYMLITPGSMMFQMNRIARRDDFVVLAMNSIAINNVETGENAFGRMFRQGKLNEKSVRDADDEVLNTWLMSNEFQIIPVEHIDKKSGRVYYTIDFLGANAIKGYYTQQCWSTDNIRFYFRDDLYRIWEYNTKTYAVRYIDSSPTGWDNQVIVTPKNNLYYLNIKKEFIRMNIDTYEKVKVAEMPIWQKTRATLLQVNNDETKFSVEWKDTSGEFDSDKMGRLPIYDLEKGEWDLRWIKGFDVPWYYGNHPCINPVYDNYLFFAHEGTGLVGAQKDRVWIINTETGLFYNAIPQKQYTKDWPSEILVHEWWSYDGEKIFAVKNPNKLDGINRLIGQYGIVEMGKDGTDKRYIPAPEPLTHSVSSTVNNRWIVTDTNYTGFTYVNLYLIDALTGEDIYLANVRQTGANPGHQHPQFSPDGNKITFGLWSENGKVVNIGWMDVSDLVNQPLVGGQYDISDSCDIFGYEGFDHHIIARKNSNGEQIFTIPKGNSMYVNVKSNVSEDDNADAKISVTYLDKGLLPICIDYYQYRPYSVTGVGQLVPRKHYINRTDSGEWKTAIFESSDINLGNMVILGADFLIKGVNSEAVIKTIEVSVTK